MTIHFLIDTPVLPLHVAATDSGLIGTEFVHPTSEALSLTEFATATTTPWKKQLEEELAAYWAGELSTFTLPLADAPTPFLRNVRTQLCNVPRGEVVTYGELAALAGSPRAARAVGTACRTNPYQLIVPCHRVVAANGIGGYMGTTGQENLWIKKELLRREGSTYITNANRTA